MSQTESAATRPAAPAMRSPMDRLRHLDATGQIALVTSARRSDGNGPALTLGPRIQALSDHITALETELARHAPRDAGQLDTLAPILDRISDYRRELADLCFELADELPEQPDPGGTP